VGGCGVCVCVCVVQIDTHVVENQFQSNHGKVLRYEHLRERARARERARQTHTLSISQVINIYTQIRGDGGREQDRTCNMTLNTHVTYYTCNYP
jgi:hypothetical protein